MGRTAVVHEFEERFEDGNRGAIELDRLFAADFTIRHATRREESCGIDRWFTRHDRTVSVEYKTDWKAHASGNALIELISQDGSQGQPIVMGWSVTSQANVLLYYVPLLPTLYIVPMGWLRLRLPDWIVSCRRVIVPNAGYCTHGLLVPLAELKVLSDAYLRGERKIPTPVFRHSIRPRLRRRKSPTLIM